MKAIRIENHSKRPNSFSSLDLTIGEMMETMYNGEVHVILRMYLGFVSLTDPSCTWQRDAALLGRKLLPGEGITLIQE
jgi:hypothetical protein